MSRLGTVGLCALVLASLVTLAKGEEADATATAAADAKAKSTRAIELGSPHEMMARTKFLRVLEEPTEFDFHELPLNDVVTYLKQKHDVEIQLDTKVLEESSIGIDTPVNRTLQGTTLRSGLRLMLGALDLTYIIKDEVLLITTPDKASNELVIKIYPVGDLTTPRNGALGGEDFKPLMDAITSTIAPTTWDEVGGPGSVVALAQARSLVVSQTDEVHEQITELLAGLRQARDAQAAAPRVTALGWVVDRATAILEGSAGSRMGMMGAERTAGRAEKAESDEAKAQAATLKAIERRTIEVAGPNEARGLAKIRLTLEEETACDFTELPLEQVVMFMKDRHGIEIQIDTKALEAESIGIDTPVTRSFKNITLRSALRLMLDPLDLAYVVKDEVLMITTAKAASIDRTVSIYPIGELIAADPSDKQSQDVAALVEIIKGTVEPRTWQHAGGADIQPWAHGQALVIRQTWAGHEEIELLLASLRHTRAVAAPSGGDQAVVSK